jgi:hypothetical protein
VKWGIKRAMVRLIEPIVEVTDFLDRKMSIFIEDRIKKFSERVTTLESAMLTNKNQTIKTRFDNIEVKIQRQQKKFETDCDYLETAGKK